MKRGILVKLSILTAIPLIAIGYTNCSDVQFAESHLALEAKQLALNSGGVIINEGAEFTNDLKVTLRLEHNSADQMYVTNTPGCLDGGSWESYAVTRLWDLKEANQQDPVFVKFREVKTPDFESMCFSDDIVHENIPPEIKFNRLAGEYFNTPLFAFETIVTDNLSGVANISCDKSSGWSTGCDPMIKGHAMSEGVHFVRVQATDQAGNKSAVQEDSFVIDLTAPTISFVSTPAQTTSSLAGTFSFIGKDDLSGINKYECRISTTSSWAACSSPMVSSFPEGSNEFSVRAYDRAGNISSELTYSWIIDATAPAVQITQAPAPYVKETVANFEFNGMDDGMAITKFECRLDAQAWTSCASPKVYTGVSQGTHKFELRGYDTANNPSAPASHTWSVDTTKPVVTIVSAPSSRTATPSAAFVFTATDNASGVKEIKCSLDGAIADCSSPKNFSSLSDGLHKFEVYAIDNVGHQSATASHSWTVDRSIPVVTIVSGPTAQTKDLIGELQFTVADVGGGSIARIECRLDNGGFDVCASPKIYEQLGQGGHLVQIRAFDDVGNQSEVKTHSWFVDSLPPAINFGQIPADTILSGSSANIQFEVADAGVGLQSVECGYSGNMGPCDAISQETLTRLSVGSYIFKVEAKDMLGNSSVKFIQWVVEQGFQNVTQQISVTQQNKADVLVVIDNSGSMATEQKNMASRFGTFIDRLVGLDWQVAIVTTDLSGDKVRKDGRLLEFSGLSGQYIIHSGMDVNVAKNAFGATIYRPESGSGNEQGIGATYRALQRAADSSTPVNAPNVNFFRNDAVLSVIVVTDADETNGSGTQTHNVPSNLVNLVKSRWPDKPFVFHSIIVPVGDSACKAKDGNEGYGYSYEALSQLTGGVIGTVCSQDYAGQLGSIAQSTVEQIRSATLNCLPLDQNGDGKGDVQIVTASGIAPGYRIDGLKITFDTQLPVGNNSLSYTCVAN